MPKLLALIFFLLSVLQPAFLPKATPAADPQKETVVVEETQQEERCAVYIRSKKMLPALRQAQRNQRSVRPLRSVIPVESAGNAHLPNSHLSLSDRMIPLFLPFSKGFGKLKHPLVPQRGSVSCGR